jgi:hypothetical protein
LHSHFAIERAWTSTSDKVMWMLNTNLAVGSVVKMRMQIMLPASSPFVNLHGESSHVRKICAKD